MRAYAARALLDWPNRVQACRAQNKCQSLLGGRTVSMYAYIVTPPSSPPYIRCTCDSRGRCQPSPRRSTPASPSPAGWP